MLASSILMKKPAEFSAGFFDLLQSTMRMKGRQESCSSFALFC